MKVKIGNKIYDSEEEPIMLIFENDESRKMVAKHLESMAPKEGVRMYLTTPDSTTIQEAENFMEI